MSSRHASSVITSISLEHTAILGDTLTAIAREKAGIVKDGGVLVHAPNSAEVQRVFRETCKERGARILAADESRCEAISVTAPRGDAAGACSGDPSRIDTRRCIEYVSGSELVEGPSVHDSTGTWRAASPRTDLPTSSGNSTAPKAGREPPEWVFPAQVCAITVRGSSERCVFPSRVATACQSQRCPCRCRRTRGKRDASCR